MRRRSASFQRRLRPSLSAAAFLVAVVFLALVSNGRPIGAVITGQGALRFGLYAALVSALVALGALLASYLRLPDTLDGERYYELLFWGGGHTLQFVHVLLMLVSWLWLATVSGITSRLTPRVVLFLFVIGAAPALLTPLAYRFDIESGDHIQTMTWLMRYGGGLAALPVGLIIVTNIFQSHRWGDGLSAERSSLLSSMLLYGVGGGGLPSDRALFGMPAEEARPRMLEAIDVIERVLAARSPGSLCKGSATRGDDKTSSTVMGSW